MKALYNTEIYTDDFQIDISEKAGCKGVFKIEIAVHELSVPLLIKDGSDYRITANTPPFVLESPYPITNGLLRFEFSEYEEIQTVEIDEFKKAVVRYLYCE